MAEQARQGAPDRRFLAEIREHRSDVLPDPRHERNLFLGEAARLRLEHAPYARRRVGEELAGYIRMGYTTFILDIPASREELEHTAVAFERATARAEA